MFLLLNSIQQKEGYIYIYIYMHIYIYISYEMPTHGRLGIAWFKHILLSNQITSNLSSTRLGVHSSKHNNHEKNTYEIRLSSQHITQCVHTLQNTIVRNATQG